ncbi:glycine betaine ABC transporter substrate-binding protein [Tuberibacillus sp. Marseille-P3662]|uniref:glycine betaine ABC transporter substrate-binding protein n=1 Tax=Tuberibacillus sp. Marseille-P3662 TaxID=1965358 RepID=UPI0020CAA605|nr:glycine betaine ABC transporter substrate-binding protein [Tuberibacillus sp. Marseille-P3662]
MKKKWLILSSFLLAIFLVLSACGNQGGNNDENSNADKDDNSQSSVELGKKNLTIALDTYASAIANHNVLKAVLENVGYNVTLKQVGVGTMFSSVADGSADATLAAWLPHTHSSYWKKYKNQVNRIRTNVDGAPLGLAVPKYMKDVNSVSDLKNNSELGQQLDWTITGISPGAGEMIITKNELLPKYGLKDNWQVKPSSGSAMTAALGAAIKAHEPIVVTLWSPHWAFNKWDLKYLKDPKNVYGDPDDIYTVTRKGLKEDAPAAYKILNQYHWTKDDMNKVMLSIQNGTDPAKAGQQFVENHQDLVDKWTKGVK